MNFIQAIKSGFVNYARFSGRASRSEFWYWTLFGYLLGVAVAFLEDFIDPIGYTNNIVSLTNLLGILFILPNISVSVRRLHDVNKTGWLFFISLTIIGIIPLIIWYCTKGTNGINPYGIDPLA